MYELWLKELTDEKAVYYFQGDRKGEMGIIEVDRNTKEHKVIKEAEDSNEFWQGYAACKIREYISKNEFPEKDLIAMW